MKDDIGIAKRFGAVATLQPLILCSYNGMMENVGTWSSMGLIAETHACTVILEFFLSAVKIQI